MDCISIKNETSLVRVFHASPQAPPVDIYINESLAFSNLQYKQFSNYTSLEVGDYRIDVFQAGDTTKPIISGALNVEDGKMITVAVIGDLNDLGLLLIDDVTKKTSDDYGSFRIVNLSPNSKSIDVLVNGKSVVIDLEYKQNTSYIDARPDRYNIDVVQTIEKVLLLSFSALIKSKRIYTLYILGDVPNISSLQSVDGNTYLCK